MRRNQFHGVLLGCVVALSVGCCEGPLPLHSCVGGACPACAPPMRWGPGTYGFQATTWQSWPDDCPANAPVGPEAPAAEPLTQRQGGPQKPVTLARLPDVLTPPGARTSGSMGEAPVPVSASQAPMASTNPPRSTPSEPPVTLAIKPEATVAIKPEATVAAGAAWAAKKSVPSEPLAPGVVRTQFVQETPPVSGWRAAIARRWETE